MERSNLLPSDAGDKSVHDDAINTDDRISKLSNDLLLKIISRLSIKEAITTGSLSSRWEHVWKKMSHLFLDMRGFSKIGSLLTNVTDHHAARSMTKVINDHRGHLERCTIYYYPFQCTNAMVEAWIRSLIHVKHVKHLTLVNFIFSLRPPKKPITLDLPSETFSHPNLQTLILGRFNFETPHAFNNCGNLKTLTLAGIFAQIGVLNVVLVSCPSLEVLVANVHSHKGSGLLKIDNRNLRFLYLSCYQVDGIHVSSPNLDVLIIESLSCEIENFIIVNPRFQFHRNYRATGRFYPHTSYIIPCPHQEKKSIGHEFMMSGSRHFVKNSEAMSVSVDLTNTKEVEMLQEILVSWPGKMEELEILSKKSNAPRKEVESSSRRTQKTFWEEIKPFPDAYFSVSILWLSNFSGSKEEFALASRLITQGTVIKTMIIKPHSSFSTSNKLEIEEAVAKLNDLPKGHTELDIVMV
ncbi:unnamed protein product [Thlaspi arvense]|uniref:F-box domain-containing protein n=1 Tax=Thlaspi arvense TaxID=13288 RepID=A0AAU9T776_THLAR|nr:unnamed protein product [Thlaspi arvense]